MRTSVADGIQKIGQTIQCAITNPCCFQVTSIELLERLEYNTK